jgi:nucleoside-diphosphate-sugar epimerase
VTDVGDAYRRAAVGDVSCPFNIAAEPVVGSDELARMLRARKVAISPQLLRAAASASYKLRLQPSEPGWLDMALGVPLMSTERARRELGWRPTRTALEAIQELVAGMREGPTPRRRRSLLRPAAAPASTSC